MEKQKMYSKNFDLSSPTKRLSALYKMLKTQWLQTIREKFTDKSSPNRRNSSNANTVEKCEIIYWNQQDFLTSTWHQSARFRLIFSSNFDEKFSTLKRIKSVTNVFTLYLRETNRTTIPADINTINKVLSVILD